MRIVPRLTQLAAVCAVTLACVASQASAAVMVFTDRASYQASIGMTASDSFAALPSGAVIPGPLARSAGGYAYQASVIDTAGLGPDQGATDFFGADNGAGGTWLSTNFATSFMQFGGFSAPVRGVGGTFFSTDFFGVVTGAALTFRLVDASGTFEFVQAGGAPDGFLAFISDSLIESFSVVSDQTQVDQFATAASLELGVIPEPGSMVLLGLGALALVGARRKRNS